MKKKLLFVINTLSRAGAETALLALLRQLDPERVEVDLFVLTGQGELAAELPAHVRLLNAKYDSASVLGKAGRRKLRRTVLRSLWTRGTAIRLLPYLLGNLWDMGKRRWLHREKLLWRVLSDGAPRWDTTYDLAVAYLEGGSTYYVADHVNALVKAAFVHTDYTMAGYTRKLDRDCYQKMDRIFAPAEDTRWGFLRVYPEYEDKLEVLPNVLEVSEIRRRSRLPGGFTDDYSGTRLLTVARLTAPKALDISIEAMKLLKDGGGRFRWYVLGEGDQRHSLEQKIRALGLTEDFILWGAVADPYPYFLQADLYIHASRTEARSISIREAQVLERVILASDCGGNRETVTDGVDGKLCPLTPEGIRDGILWLMAHPLERARYAKAAGQKHQDQPDVGKKLLSLVRENED